MSVDKCCYLILQKVSRCRKLQNWFYNNFLISLPHFSSVGKIHKWKEKIWRHIFFEFFFNTIHLVDKSTYTKIRKFQENPRKVWNWLQVLSQLSKNQISTIVLKNANNLLKHIPKKHLSYFVNFSAIFFQWLCAFGKTPPLLAYTLWMSPL